jgi:CheY-like chemotaxis protein
VLLDFSMPLVDPLALAAELAACRPRPAVLMLSALASEQSAIRASAAGAVGWILKDAEPDALFTALLRAARSADPAWEARAALVAEVLALGMDAPTSSVLEEIARHEPSDADPAQAAADPATSDAAKKLDARAVRALLRALRALHGDLMGASASELAGHAVVSPRTAERILKRLLGRDPALVARVDLDAPECRYVLTAAGEQELERLERHIAREAGDADAASVACGAH